MHTAAVKKTQYAKISFRLKFCALAQKEMFGIMKINERLKELRKSSGYLQKDVADYLNISKSAYGYYEQGRNEMDISAILKLTELYKVSSDYLLCKTDIKLSELSPNESEILMKYRTLDNNSKNIIYGALIALSAKNDIND